MPSINNLSLRLKHLPATIKVLSFDVFDTLLMRLSSDDRVARLSAKIFSELFYLETKSILSYEDIINSRFKFKRKMDKIYFFKEAEWTLSSWLETFANEKAIDPKIFLHIGRQSELKAEAMSVYAIPGSKELLTNAKKNGHYLIATSDTWLDQEWLNQLLIYFELHFDKVISSGTMGVSKRRGTIFPQIEQYLNFKQNAYLHIGDNLKADFIRPQLFGWKSIWMPHQDNLLKTRSIPIKSKYRKMKKSWKDIVKALTPINTRNKNTPFFKL